MDVYERVEVPEVRRGPVHDPFALRRIAQRSPVEFRLRPELPDRCHHLPGRAVSY